MKRIYDRTVKELMFEFVEQYYSSGSDNSRTFNKQEILKWFDTKYPKIKLGTINAHLLKLSINAPSRIHYNVHNDGTDDLLYQINAGTFRKYNKNIDSEPLYKDSSNAIKEVSYTEDQEDVSDNEFAYEKDLQNFLAKNLNLIEDGLSLYQEDDIPGIEFPVGGRFIDILALDKNNNYVVIELKVSRGYDRVIGQILRYMAWIEKNQIEKGQKVRGIIIAKEISEDLILACSKISDVQLFEYELSVKLHEKSFV